MNKKLTRSIASIAVTAVLSINTVFAAGTSDFVKIETIDAWGAGGYMIELQSSTRSKNPDNCGNAGTGATRPFVFIPGTLANRDALYSNVLTALINGNRVRFWLKGCQGVHPKVSNVALYR